jgi:hypothetical protein
MQVIPIEKEIPNKQQALPYEQVSNIIENSQSFAVFDCICKKEKHLLDDGCDKPLEICTAYAPIPGAFDDRDHFRSLSKTEAYAVLNKAEEAGLVHLTWNVELQIMARKHRSDVYHFSLILENIKDLAEMQIFPQAPSTNADILYG